MHRAATPEPKGKVGYLALWSPGDSGSSEQTSAITAVWLSFETDGDPRVALDRLLQRCGGRIIGCLPRRTVEDPPYAQSLWDWVGD